MGVPFSGILPMILLTTWAALSMLWTWGPSSTISTAISYGTLTLGVIAVGDTFSHDVLRAIGALAAGTTLVAAYILIFGDVATNLQAQISGIDQNITAFSLTIGLAALLYVIGNVPGRVRALAVVGALVTVGALLVVGSRTGVGSVLMMSVVFMLVMVRNPRAVASFLFLACLSFVAFKVISDRGLLPQRIQEFLVAPTLVDTRQEIIVSYLAYREMWQWLGVGAGADVAFGSQVAGELRNAHSGFWRVWIEEGVVGLTLWSALLIQVARGAFRRPEFHFFVLAAVPIIAFMYTLGPIRSNMMWVVFALALTGLPRHKKSRAIRATS